MENKKPTQKSGLFHYGTILNNKLKSENLFFIGYGLFLSRFTQSNRSIKD